MKRNTNDLLRSILKNEVNKDVAHVISNLIRHEEAPQLLKYEELFAMVPDKNDELEVGEATVKDYRIEWMTFCNFRSVPDSHDKKLFGVNFTENGTPKSLFLVGSNGAGKTTLYSALEHYYLSVNSLSKDMDLESEKILTYGFGQIEGQQPVRLRVKTKNYEDVQEIELEHEGFSSPASFCSEYDLRQLGEKGNDLTEYILEQLGYDDLSALIDRLKLIIEKKEKDLKENSDPDESDMTAADYESMIAALLKDSAKAKELLTKARERENLFNVDYTLYGEGKKTGRFTVHWKRLQSLTEKPKSDMPIAALEKGSVIKRNAERANGLTRKLMQMYRMLEESLQVCKDKSRIGLQQELDKYYRDKISLSDKEARSILPEIEVNQARVELKTLREVLKMLVDSKESIIRLFKTERFPMIKDILEIFSNNDGELYIAEDAGDNRLKIEVKDPIAGKNTFHATPQEYYNSFRYKLYAVSFKIALALMEMKEENIRVPLVIDDVFNASDFENNIRLEYFVHNIYKAYDSMDMGVPMQLILLTHDEMVQAAFKKGADLQDEDSENKQTKMSHGYICGRIFSYRYAERMSQEISEEGFDGSFYNLYLRN